MYTLVSLNSQLTTSSYRNAVVCSSTLLSNLLLVIQMYESGVPEKVIQEPTGHKSLESLRVYERTNAQQHQTVSNVYLHHILVPIYNEQVQISRQHSSFSSMSPKQPCSALSVSISLSNLQGCMININNTPETGHTPPMSSFDLTHAELDKLYSDFLD